MSESSGSIFHELFYRGNTTIPNFSFNSSKKIERSKGNKKGNSYIYNRISPDQEDLVISTFRKETGPYLERKYKSAEPNIRAALRKYCAYVQGWLDTTQIPEEFREQLIYYGLKASGVKILKAIRLKAFIAKFNLEFLEYPTEVGNTGILFKDLPTIPVRIVGDILNYRFCIFYDEDIDDFEKGFKIVSQDEKYLKRYKYVLGEYCEKYLPEELNLSDPRMFYYTLSGSVCIDGQNKTHNYDVQRNKLEPVSPLKGERVLIPISADNIRDGILTDVNTLTYIQWINYEINKLFGKTPHYTFALDPTQMKRKIRRFSEKFNYYACIDLEKEGITKPRSLITIVADILEEIYGPNKLSESIKILYSSFELRTRKKIYNKETGKRENDFSTYFMPRGHGLGMANALTTVMQVGIVLSAIYEFKKEFHIEPKFGMLTFNDDLVVGFKKNYTRDYCECHYNVCEGLSHTMKRTKTFMGKAFVFCEEYSDEAYNNKSAYIRGFINSILFARNITQAKQLLTSVDFTYISRLQTEIDRVISKWGYEFYPDEYKAPIAFGGWWTKKMNGVDLTFSDYLPDTNATFAYFACKERHGKLKVIDHPLQEYVEEDLSIFIKDRYYSPEAMNQYFDKLYLKRKKTFEKEKTAPISKIFEDYRDNCHIDVLPPKEISTEVDIDEAPFRLPSFGRPIENYYAYYGFCENHKGLKERFSYLHPRYEDRLISKPFNLKMIKQNYFINQCNIDVCEDLSTANYIYCTDPDISLEEYYIEPTNVALIYLSLHPSKFGKIPIYKKLEACNKKLDIWGRFPTSNDINTIGLVLDNPLLYKKALELGFDKVQEALEILKQPQRDIKPIEVPVKKLSDEFINVLDKEGCKDIIRRHLKGVPSIMKIFGYDPIARAKYSGNNPVMIEAWSAIYPYIELSAASESLSSEAQKNNAIEKLNQIKDFLIEISEYVRGTLWEIHNVNETYYCIETERFVRIILSLDAVVESDQSDYSGDNDVWDMLENL